MLGRRRKEKKRKNSVINSNPSTEFCFYSKIIVLCCFRTPTGLEDVSKYPELFAELLAKGWIERDIQKLAGLNLIRVFKAVEQVRIHQNNKNKLKLFEFTQHTI